MHTKRFNLPPLLFVSLLIATMSSAPSSASLVGPVAPSFLAYDLYVGVIAEGEVDDVRCTLTTCGSLCFGAIRTFKYTLTVASPPESRIVLRAIDWGTPPEGDKTVEVEASGLPLTAELQVIELSTCYRVWVIGLDLTAPAPYTLRVDW